MTSPKFMIAVNFIALYSFLIPLYMISSIRDESEMFFSESSIGITLENKWECFLFEKLHNIAYCSRFKYYLVSRCCIIFSD